MTTGRVMKRNGKWAYVISLPYDPVKGRYPQRWRSGFETKKAAQEALAQDVSELDANAASKATMTLGEYLYDWLKQSIENKKAPRTYETYRHTCESFIIPYIGNIKLGSLDHLHIEDMYKKLGQRVQSSSVHRAHRVLRAALNRAVKRGIIRNNPMTRTEAPSAKIEHRNPLDLTQLQLISEWLQSRHPVTHIAVQLAIYTGMRRGELCGLKWSDIDWEHRTIRVIRSRQRRYGVDIVGSPKTAGSTRPIPIGSQLMELLEKWKGRLHEHVELREEKWSNDVYVLQRLDGVIIDPSTLAHDFHKAVLALNLPNTSFHDLRHTHATLLLQANVPMKVVSERLGHSSIILTANTYSHVTETMQSEAVDKLDNILRNMSDK